MTEAELNVLIDRKVADGNLLEAYRIFEESTWGRIIKTDLMMELDPLGDLFAPDPYTTAFNLGKVYASKYLLRMIVRATAQVNSSQDLTISAD